MRKLEKQFVMNADKVGDNKFIQVKRTEDVAMYRRERLDGTLKGYEVFIVKRRYKGDPLPGQNGRYYTLAQAKHLQANITAIIESLQNAIQIRPISGAAA